MKSRAVSFSDRAQDDLLKIEIWLESQAGTLRARSYVDRLIDACMKLELASHRGANRSDILPGLRTVGFERRVTIAFIVDETNVLVLRLFTAGRDWISELSEE